MAEVDRDRLAGATQHVWVAHRRVLLLNRVLVPGEGGEQRLVVAVDSSERAERPKHALLPVDQGAIAIEGEGAKGARRHRVILRFGWGKKRVGGLKRNGFAARELLRERERGAQKVPEAGVARGVDALAGRGRIRPAKVFREEGQHARLRNLAEP